MEKGHRIGKDNVLSVNVNLFQGDQKDIRVGLSGRNNIMPLLICLQKNSRDFRTIRETKSAISRLAQMFQMFS